MAGDLIYLKCYKRFDWDLILVKMLEQGTAKVRLESSIIQKAKIRYGWDFTAFKMFK